MSFLNSSTPLVKCLLRKEYLYNLESHLGEYEECYIFGVSAIKQRALGFHAMIGNGAVFWRLPISAFCYKPCEPMPLPIHSFWDAISYHISVTNFEMLKHLTCTVFMKDKQKINGEYVFTIDFCDPNHEAFSAYAETPDEHKCAHLIKIDNGNFCLYPNNRILWQEASFVVKDNGRPDYKTNTHRWISERNFVTEDSDKFFYDTEAK